VDDERLAPAHVLLGERRPLEVEEVLVRERDVSVELQRLEEHGRDVDEDFAHAVPDGALPNLVRDLVAVLRAYP
jgi:hypothetical protein